MALCNYLNLIPGGIRLGSRNTTLLEKQSLDGDTRKELNENKRGAEKERKINLALCCASKHKRR